MKYEQLKPDEEIWKNFQDQITFNHKNTKNAPQAAHFIKVPFKDALSLVS
jgi:hypothetical protein